MRLRKRSRPEVQPGDEFLRAVSSASPAPRPHAPRAAAEGDEGFGELRQQLLESERRAAAAEEALRQVREQGDERLEQARAALARERDARLAAEGRLAQLETGAEGPPLPPEPQPASEPEAGQAPVAPAEDLAFPEAEQPSPGDEGDWPTPWLEDEGRSHRGLFRRSGS